MPAIARAYVEILPETRKFSDLVAAAIRQIADPVITPTADVSRIKADFDALMSTLDAPPIAPVVDPTQAKAALEELSQEIDPKVLPAADVTAAASALADLAQEIDPKVIAQPDVSAAREAIAEISKPVDVKVTGNPDFSKVRAEIAEISKPVDVPVTTTDASGRLRDANGRFVAGGGSGGGSGGGAGEAAGLLGGVGVAAGGAAAGAAAVGLFTKESIGNAQDFLVQLRLAKIEMGLTDEQTKVLRQSMIDLGNDQVLGAMSAGDAAVAYRELGKATTLTFDQLQAAAKPALEFAIIAQTDAATGAQTFGQSLNALKVPAADAIKYLNEMVQADQLAVGSMSDLGESLFRAAPQFTQVFGPGQRQQLQASLVALSQFGVVGPKAGYAMSQLAQDVAGGNNTLAKAEETLTAAAKERGVQIAKGGTIFKDAKGNMLPYEQILKNLNTALKDRSAADYAKLTANLSDETKRALPALLGSTDAIHKNAAAIEEAGRKQELADQKAKAYAKTTDAIAGAWETVTILFGEKVLPVFDKLGGLVASAFSAIATAIDKVDFGSFVTKFGEVTGIDYEGLKTRVTDAFHNIGEVISTDVVPLIRDHLIPTLQTAWEVFQEKILPVLKKVADFIVTEVVPAMGKIAIWILEHGIPALMDFWKWFNDKIVPVLGDVARFIINDVVPALGKVASWIIDHVVPAAQDLWKIFNDKVLPILKDVWKIASDVWGILTDLASIIGTVAAATINLAGPLVLGLLKQMLEGVKLAAELVKPVIGGFLDGVAATVKSVEGGLRLLKSVLDDIEGAAKSVASALSRIKAPKIDWPDVPSWVPVVGGKHADGGYFAQATWGMFGEAGAEAIMPLTRPKRMQELLADPRVSSPILQALAANGSQHRTAAQQMPGSVVQHITVPTAEHALIYARAHAAELFQRARSSGALA